MKNSRKKKDENKKIKNFFNFFSIIFYLVFSVYIFAQSSTPIHFSQQSDSISNKESFVLGLPDNSMLMLWYDRSTHTLISAKSYDEGLSWSYTNGIAGFNESSSIDLNAVVLSSGRILVSFKFSRYLAIYSDDNGESWSEPDILPTFPLPYERIRVAYTSLSKSSDGDVIFVYSYSAINYPDTIPHKGIYTIRSSDGTSWSINQVIDSLGRNGNIVGISTNKDILVYETTNETHINIAYRTSSNSGYSWSDKQILLSDGYDKLKPRIVKDNTDKLWLLYYRKSPTVFEGYTQNEIYFITSTDHGLNWTQPEKFSDYAGDDELLSLSTWNGLPIVSFGSTRDFNFQNNFYQIYYGIPGVSIDDSTPPFLYGFSIIPQHPEDSEPITFRTYADDENSLSSVKVIVNANGNIDSLAMFDDGIHNDSLPGDNIYGVVIENGFSNGTLLVYDFLLTDVDNNSAGFIGSYVTIPNFNYYDVYPIEVNKLKLPLNNKGVLAGIEDSTAGLHFEESSVLFSGGFYLSGYHQNEIWTNAVASSTLLWDYLPGPVGSDPNDFRNSIYVIKSTDPPFGQTWISYRYAVDIGADFYDGDENGIYLPVDLNGNGVWDANEDRPDFLGDVTVWCVYNDKVPAWQRRFGENPMGIEIHQSIFAISDELNPIDNMIFIRYRIINKGTVSAQFDSVYFGLWDDPDIGDYIDDLVGCDNTLNLGYSYNDGYDESYGSNPPAFGAQILAGPVVYIPGETFIDVNGNNIYDEGIDTPIDTAFINQGEIMGVEHYPGAKTLGATSFIHFMNGNQNMNDPSLSEEARNYLRGRNRVGELINPCDWQYGSIYGIPCEDVNPLFLYSGNPSIPEGWINNFPTDQRILNNTGSFTLKQDEEVDIWTAYIVARGSNAIESVTKLKSYSLGAKYFYESNFTELPSNVNRDKDFNPLVEYSLFQNYPNPFNPVTIIRYQLPITSRVTLKVFDILGREVETLVNEEKPAGKYEVKFNASDLSSGVYFYQLKIGSFIQTKKMLLLK